MTTSSYLLINSLFLEIIHAVEFSAQVMSMNVNWSSALDETEGDWCIWEF
jgi:hypothetical protein